LAVLVAVAVLLALGFGVAATRAQDDAAEIVLHPAHIHAGSCADLDPNPQAPLNDVAPVGYDPEAGTMSQDVEARGSLAAASVAFSESEAEIGFDEVLETTHAINVHESSEHPEVYIACGDVGGPVVDDELVVALQEQNDSGYFGIAVLEPGDDDTTKVTLYLAQAAEAGGETPEATPDA
jgi:hypothetical protein